MQNLIQTKFILLFLVLCLIACKDETQVENSVPLTPIVLVNPSSGSSGMSRMFAAPDGLYMSWVEQTDSLAILKYAVYNQEQWDTPKIIAQGTDWFVNWADFPAIAVNKGNIFAHYLQKSAPDTYTYDIQYKVYNAENKVWSSARKLHSDATKSEHGFVSVMPYNDGFMASWLDGRTTVNRPDSLKQMTIRAGIVNADGSLGKQWELDGRVCDCCATAIAQTPEGPQVVYRDRSKNEVRDTYKVTLKDSSWTNPIAVAKENWIIPGCPVNGPAISSNLNTTSMAWFTAPKDSAAVRLKLSGLVDPITVAQNNVIGRVATVVDRTETTYVLYMGTLDDVAQLNLKSYNKKGEEVAHVIVAQTSYERASGFPQLAVFKDNLYVSWTTVDRGVSQVQMAYYPLNKLNNLH